MIKDPTDYYASSWIVEQPRKTFKELLPKRLLLATPFIALTLWVSWKLSVSQREVYPEEIFSLQFLYWVIFWVTVILLTHRIGESMSAKKIHYRISRRGLEIETRLIGFQEFDRAKLSKALLLWDDTIEELDFEIPMTSLKNVYLHFGGPDSRKRFNRALRKYMEIS